MAYYTQNGIYNYLSRNKLPNYYFSVKNNWMMLYGPRKTKEPKFAIFFAQTDSPDWEITSEQKRNGNMYAEMAKDMHLPFLSGLFHSKGEQVHLFEDGKWKDTTFAGLKDTFNQRGVGEGTYTPELKGINRYYSSREQVWSRKNIHNAIATDLDLTNYHNGKYAVYELKRSRVPLNDWRPYPEDYNNFILTKNAFKRADNIDFYLLYNHFTEPKTGQRTDDISKVKLYKFDLANSSPAPRLLGTYSPEDIFVGRSGTQKTLADNKEADKAAPQQPKLTPLPKAMDAVHKTDSKQWSLNDFEF